jgi:hypothetical protein
MLKANGEYLDFNDDIEVESQVKLFEDIESMQGDWSYSFQLSKTNNNLKILGLPFPDTVKSIYRSIPAEVIDDSGFKVYTGSLRVDRISEVINCSFFSGNNDWFGLLSDPISALPLFKYDTDLTENNVTNSWQRDSGIVFPILDIGALVTRSYNNLKTEDFTACFYVKTLFNEIFGSKGIKLRGDLLKDSTYNMLTIASNSKSEEDIRSRSCYVNKTTSQTNISALTKITFQDETTFPFFDGSQNNFVNSTYTADVKTRVDVELVLFADGVGGISIFQIEYYINGVYTGIAFSYSVNDTGGFLTKNISFELNQFDYLEIYVEVTGLANVNIRSGSIKITPTYVYRVFGSSSVPKWTQLEFVSNILRLFNVLPSYNSDSKTLTLDLFNKIKEKEEIDISDDIEVTEEDYSDFISSYAKSNVFKYQDGSDEDLQKYNVNNFIKYGSGTLEVSNDFIEHTATIVESDFTSPITYLNGAFDMSMDRINFVELEEVEETTVTSVSDSSGVPRFNISNADDTFTGGDLVRLETNVDGYNGEWVISVVTSTYITVNGLGYSSSATGTATLLRHQFTTDNNVYLFITTPLLEVSFFSSNSSVLMNEAFFPDSFAKIAFFNLLSNGREINNKYKQSLSFGAVNDPLSYQKTLLDTYWPIFSAILNDPVMLRVKAFFKKSKFILLKTFLRPLRVTTTQSSNLYYLNRITGYKSGEKPCDGELIKL